MVNTPSKFKPLVQLIPSIPNKIQTALLKLCRAEDLRCLNDLLRYPFGKEDLSLLIQNTNGKSSVVFKHHEGTLDPSATKI